MVLQSRGGRKSREIYVHSRVKKPTHFLFTISVGKEFFLHVRQKKNPTTLRSNVSFVSRRPLHCVSTSQGIQDFAGNIYLCTYVCTQGCQMVCFQTKNPNFGKICRALEKKMLLYFITFWNISRPFGIIYSLLV
jgi:hypothetical protein